MFLQVMNKEEKEKFLELVYKVANIDGEFAEEEQEIIDSYKAELGIPVIPESSDIEGLLKYFSDKASEIKKIVLFEIIGLINADDKIDVNEKMVLEKMQDVFGLKKEMVDKIQDAARRLQEVYDEVYEAIFD